MRLRDLLEERLDDLPTFLARYPRPALLVAGAATAPLPADLALTPENPAALLETQSDDALDLLARLRQTQDAVRASVENFPPETRVDWCLESEHNTFPGLISVGRRRRNDIVLAHAGISKVHATLSNVAGTWCIEDRRSRNGTFLNGTRLEPDKRHELHDGATLGFGNELTARFLLPASVWYCVRSLSEGR